MKIVPRSRQGFTILELTLVILVLLGIVATFFGVSQPISNWQRASEAGLTLREVEVAQRQFLADNPQVDITTVTEAQVAPYLDGNPAVFPVVEDEDGNGLDILVDQSPPVYAEAGTSTSYDPSGASDDGLWDVGK